MKIFRNLSDGWRTIAYAATYFVTFFGVVLAIAGVFHLISVYAENPAEVVFMILIGGAFAIFAWGCYSHAEMRVEREKYEEERIISKLSGE